VCWLLASRLSDIIKNYIRIFLENFIVSGVILASVILLSIFIFIEMASSSSPTVSRPWTT
jgi:hypothetical protein